MIEAAQITVIAFCVVYTTYDLTIRLIVWRHKQIKRKNDEKI